MPYFFSTVIFNFFFVLFMSNIFSIFSNVILFFNCDLLFLSVFLGLDEENQMCLKFTFTDWAQVSEHSIAILMVHIYHLFQSCFFVAHEQYFLNFLKCHTFFSTGIFYFFSVFLVLNEENQMCLKLIFTYWEQVSELYSCFFNGIY